MNADALAMRNGNKHGTGNKSSGAESDGQEGAGRPEKEDNEKSDKTIANRESM